MPNEAVLFIHGFASSAKAAKADFLRKRFKKLPNVELHVPDFNVTSVDFEHLTVTGMINRLRQYLLDYNLDNTCFIGSSLGALVSLHYAHRFGNVRRLLLLAPLLFYRPFSASKGMLEQWNNEGSIDVFHYAFNENVPLSYNFHLDGLNYARHLPPPAPVHILHGKNDDLVPIQNSREYAENYPDSVKLTELESDHMLHDQFDVIWEHTTSFLLS
jgi:pimeloyl-ACP methyl ester carboxylesterase